LTKKDNETHIFAKIENYTPILCKKKKIIPTFVSQNKANKKSCRLTKKIQSYGRENIIDNKLKTKVIDKLYFSDNKQRIT